MLVGGDEEEQECVFVTRTQDCSISWRLDDNNAGGSADWRVISAGLWLCPSVQSPPASLEVRRRLFVFVYGLNLRRVSRVLWIHLFCDQEKNSRWMKLLFVLCCV